MLPGLTFLVAVYLAFDVANPMMPGALAFSTEDSVEVRLAHRPPAQDLATASARTAERLKPIADVVVSTDAFVSRPRISRRHASRRRLPPPPPPAPSEDD